MERAECVRSKSSSTVPNVVKVLGEVFGLLTKHFDLAFSLARFWCIQ